MTIRRWPRAMALLVFQPCSSLRVARWSRLWLGRCRRAPCKKKWMRYSTRPKWMTRRWVDAGEERRHGDENRRGDAGKDWSVPVAASLLFQGTRVPYDQPVSVRVY